MGPKSEKKRLKIIKFKKTKFRRLQTKNRSSVGAEQNKIKPNDLHVRKKERRTVVNPKSEIVYLYIQMEFCEKNTLRTAIDSGLVESNTARVWKLFREILDGINHVHRNAMIHRDLKPENIFLTVDDHVKIGDFGLAMADTFKAAKSQRNATSATDNLTSCAGTLMYMAPELNNRHYQIYNQSVDIYSVGIILFEMTYSFGTAMERFSCLKNIREKTIQFPKDFDFERHKKEHYLIKQMLDHDPLQRPTAKKLLQSQLVPIPEKENREVCEILDYCLTNKTTSAHTYLYLRLFEQIMEPIDEVNFNLMTASNYSNQKNVTILDPLMNSLLKIVKNVATKVFEVHGANEIHTPHLNPVGETFKNRKINVKQVTRTGHIVSLPANLHVPFARFVAENDLLNVRRFTIKEIFHEHLSDIIGHPKEITQAAFDIIDIIPNNNFDPLKYDIELIEIVLEIIEKLSIAKNFSYKIMLNHCDIIRAFLLFSGIANDRHPEIFRILLKIKDEKLRSPQIKTHLANLNLSKETIEHILKFLLIETSIEKFVLLMKSFTKRKDEVGQLTRKSLSCFEHFIRLLENANIFKQEKVLINPGLIEDFDQYDGLIYQLISTTSDKKQNVILAFGGNYSKLLGNFKDFFWRTTRMVRDNTKMVQISIGITVHLKNFVNLMRTSKNVQLFDVFICSIRCGNDGALGFSNPSQLCEIIGELKKHNMNYVCFNIKSIKDIGVIRNEYPVQNILILDANEPTVLLQKFNRNQLREFTIEIHELIDKLEINRKSFSF